MPSREDMRQKRKAEPGWIGFYDFVMAISNEYANHNALVPIRKSEALLLAAQRGRYAGSADD